MKEGEFQKRIEKLFTEFANPLDLLPSDVGVFSKIELRKWFIQQLGEAKEEFPHPDDVKDWGWGEHIGDYTDELKKWFVKWFGMADAEP